MTKIISQFKNSLTGEVYQIGAGEGGGATDPAIVEQIYADMRTFQKHTDDNLIGDDKNLVNVINQLITRVNQLEGYHALLYDDGFTLSMTHGANMIDEKVILENVPAGKYTISSDWIIQSEVAPEPYSGISVVAIKTGVETIPCDTDTFYNNSNVLEVIGAPLNNNTTTIQVNEPFDLVVYLADNRYIEEIIENYNTHDEALCDITATINNIKVVKV